MIFKPGTKNAAIFQTTAPYKNPYQGTAPKWLFVCSAGLLRSPTGATLAGLHGINARSCGSSVDYALVTISANLVMWADKIIFVNQENFKEALKLFDDADLLTGELIGHKTVVLDVPDNYEYMQPELVKFYEENLFDKYAM